MKKNGYWFYIDSFVHTSIKKQFLLFYNPYTGKVLEYFDNPDILRLVRKLQAPGSLWVTHLTETDLANPIIREFVNAIRANFMGDLLDAAYSKGKPVQMPPIAKIQKAVKYLKAEEVRSVGEGLLDYLAEVSIYVNNYCNLDCTICTGAFKQFNCCTADRSRCQELDFEKLKHFFVKIKGSSLLKMNIIGGNVFAYSKLNQLVDLAHSLPTQKNYFLHYLNISDQPNRLKELVGPNTQLKIPVTFPVNEERFKIALEVAGDDGFEPIPVFVIKCQKDFEKAESLLASFSKEIKMSKFHAFYNGNNLDFFEENIYIDRPDIEEARPSLKDIYTNSEINSLDFGKLTVLSDGGIYANLNAPRLGVLGQHSIYNTLFKEMNHGRSWRKTRKKISPCNSCTFEKLCPPISNYNYVMGKYNLCRIWKP